MPFIAIDILKCIVEHAADHDAESLLYVLIWIVFTQAGRDGLNRKMTRTQFDKSILRSWSPPGDLAPTSLDDISSIKKSTMVSESQFNEHIINRMHPYFLPLEPCLVLLHEALFPFEGRIRRDPADAFKVVRAVTTDAIRRDKLEVFHRMEVAFQLTIEHLEKMGEAAEVSTELPTVPDPSVATTRGAADDASKEGEGPEFSVVHHMKLRNHLTDSEKKHPAVDTPQDTVPHASGNEENLYEHALRNSHLQHQFS